MSEIERRALLGAAGVAGIAALAKAGGTGRAGPLDPPPGAVAPTSHTLDEAYNRIPSFPNGSGDGRIAIAGGANPVVINQSGSYVLTGNITVGSAVALAITASDVTLDLNGFTVTSASGASSVVLLGSAANPTNITLRNGTVAGGTVGVSVAFCVGPVIEDLRIVGPKQAGVMYASGGQARAIVVRRCTITDVGITTHGSDGNMTIAGISLPLAASIITDNVIGRMMYNGSGTVTFLGITTSGPAAASVLVARNTLNCNPAVVSTSTVPSTGIQFAGPVTGIVRDNTVFGFTVGYSAFAGSGGSASMINGGGNV